MGLIEDIGTGPVCLDTCLFIYFIEEDKRYISVVSEVFEAIDAGQVTAVTSGITLLESLVIPLRAKDLKLADQYKKLLSESRGLTLLELNQDLLYQGALLRAKFDIKTPDALQIAAAKSAHCSAFVTNDRRLPKIPGLAILQLSEYL